MPGKDPFSGLHLPEQSGTTKLDQKLFASEPAPAVAAPKPAESSKAEEINKPTKSSTTPPALAASAGSKPLSSAAPRFDLDDEPFYKASYLFTQEELEALEDLKLELRREYDTKVTKNELIRSALHLLLEDHATNKTRSYASRKVGKRGTR